MSYIPSHRNSQNERSEMRANWKTEMRRAAELKKPVISREEALAKMNRMAAALVANGAVSVSENCYKIRTGKRFYPVYVIKGVFRCACSEDEKYGVCSHVKAAEAFAAKAEAEAAKQARLQQARFALEVAEARRNAASEDFHYQAGEIEMHYLNTDYWEAA